jgi:acyl carrier protein
MEREAALKVKEILNKYSRGRETVEEDVDIKDLRIDSLNMIRAVVEMEKAFSIKFDVTKLNEDVFVTVKDMIDYINEQ